MFKLINKTLNKIKNKNLNSFNYINNNYYYIRKLDTITGLSDFSDFEPEPQGINEVINPYLSPLLTGESALLLKEFNVFFEYK